VRVALLRRLIVPIWSSMLHVAHPEPLVEAFGVCEAPGVQLVVEGPVSAGLVPGGRGGGALGSPSTEFGSGFDVDSY
ncbi:unnamed protein product, partial [Prorocentrum cordatum]